MVTSWTNGEAGAVTLGLQPALSRVGFLRKSDNLSDVDWCGLSMVVWRKRTQFATVADRPRPAIRQSPLCGRSVLASEPENYRARRVVHMRAPWVSPSQTA